MKPVFAIAFFHLALACAALAGDSPVSFNRDVRPILSDKCYYCHGSDANHRKADRRLDTREGALADLDGVKAIVPGKPELSDAISRIFTSDDDELMPPAKSNKALTAAEKDILKRWVAEGAKYEAHWAFVAPVRPVVPAGVKAIDYWVEQTLRAKALSWSPQAEAGPLLRRVSLDLTGLPPTLAELEAFEKAAAVDFEAAYSAAIDRLFASPRYGERMAIDWLDAARYSDTNGYQKDAQRMNWPWRDWVVNAFNANMRFDRFTLEQLAGDLLHEPTEQQLIATAFNRNHMLNAEGGTIAEENRTKTVFDRVETTGTTWLGLTMNCCQCHDHKFDPLKQSDYYGMFGLFNQVSEVGEQGRQFGRKSYSDDYDSLYMVEQPYITVGTAEQKAKLAAAVKAREQAEADFVAGKDLFHDKFVAWVTEMRADPKLIEERLPTEVLRRAVSAVDFGNYKNFSTSRLLTAYLLLPEVDPAAKSLKAKMEDAILAEEQVMETIPHVMVMRDDKPRETRILKRGSYETPGDVVSSSVPAFLPALPVGAKADRLALAKWLVAPEQPLMARVVVNRLWQMCFGHGLVKTPDDFGLQGALPSHPELLDWLAVEFRESGWDVQHLLKLILTSRTYRQSGSVTPALLASDPENTWLARGPRFRLDSRLIRDQALAIAGLLVEQRGGAPVSPYQPPGIVEEMSFGKNRYFQDHGDDLYRRSLYTFWRRSVAPASFFDVPARQVCAVKPSRTNTPLQALTTLNDPTYVEAARVWAEKLHELPDDNARLHAAIRTATAREAEARELASLTSMLVKARAHFAAEPAAAAKLIATGESPRRAQLDATEHAAWTTVCLLILNLDETLTR